MKTPRERLVGRLRDNDVYRRKHEKLFSDRRIAKKDILLVYESIFLFSYVSFENFLEEQFLYLLVGDTPASHGKARRRIKVASRQNARSAIYGGENYQDWLPYRLTEKRARAFFDGGKPFTNLTKNDTNLLDKHSIIRNAIAHRSRHSLSRMNAVIAFPGNLLPHQRRPADFLRSSFSIGTTQYENEISTLVRVSEVLDA